MTGEADVRRQRALMATDLEWERIGRAADAAGMDRSRYLVRRALTADALAPEVLRRAIRETLVLSLLEERRLREGGGGSGVGRRLRRGGRMDRARGGA